MSALKYSDYIVSKPKTVSDGIPGIESTRLMTVDREILSHMFHADATWLWSGASTDKVERPHTHDHDEVMAFIGSDQANPQDLGGEITIWLNGTPQILDKTCLVFVPAGAVHTPIIFSRIDRPVMFARIYPGRVYEEKPVPESGSGPACTVITEVVEFNGAGTGQPPPQRPPDSDLEGARVMHLEDHVAKGSFYVDFVWIYRGTGQAPAEEHNHDWEELIAMAVCDPENPYDMGTGRMSIVLGDETHYIDKSSMVCIPPGLKHCPWKFLGVEKPTLVFTAGPSGTYTGSHRKEEA